MRSTLYREEALRASAPKVLGSIVVRTSGLTKSIVITYALLCAGLVALILCANYTSKVRVHGVLAPVDGVDQVVSPEAGVLRSYDLHDGQHVEKGDALFLIYQQRSTPLLANADDVVTGLIRDRIRSLNFDEAAIQEQRAVRIRAAEDRRRDLARTATTFKRSLELQHQRLAMTEDLLRRYKELKAEDFVSPLQVQQRESDLIDEQLRLDETERSLIAVQQQYAETENSLREVRIQGAREQEAAKRTTDDMKRQAAESDIRRDVLIRALRAGTISNITVRPGQAVRTGQPLATVIPVGATIQVDLFVPSRAVGSIKVNDPVVLRFEAYPYQKFGISTGRVLDVSLLALSPSTLSLEGGPSMFSRSTEPLFRVRVVPVRQTLQAYGREWPLQPGGLVDATVLLDTRRLYQWILEPLYSLSGRL